MITEISDRFFIILIVYEKQRQLCINVLIEKTSFHLMTVLSVLPLDHQKLFNIIYRKYNWNCRHKVSKIIV